MSLTDQGNTANSGAANGGGGKGARAPTETSQNIFFTDYEKYETCLVNRKMESITGSVFVFVSRQAAILAQNALETVWRLCPDPLGELSAAPDLGEGEMAEENDRAKGGREGTQRE